MVLFIMLYKGVLSFEFGDEILKCDHSNEHTEQYNVCSCGAVHHAVQVDANFESLDEILKF